MVMNGKMVTASDGWEGGYIGSLESGGNSDQRGADGMRRDGLDGLG